jgi:hypothetical protein
MGIIADPLTRVFPRVIAIGIITEDAIENTPIRLSQSIDTNNFKTT